MFCCNQQTLTITIAQHPADYSNNQLFDQQPRQYIRNSAHTHPITNQCSVVETADHQLEFEPKNNTEALISLELEESNQSMKITYRPPSAHEPIWRVLTTQESHPLHKGDRIKIGMTEFNIYSHHSPNGPPVEEKQKKRKQHCRYCLSCQYSTLDPLVSLCRCSGTGKFIHLQCLRDWLMTKMEKDTHGTVTFYVTKPQHLRCEICKEKWPSQLVFEGTNHSLLSFEEQDASAEHVAQDPYLILQVDTLDEDTNQEIVVFARINVEDRFLIGNNQEMGVNMTLETPGVSPVHCSIYAKENQFFLRDQGSMAGTSVTLHPQEEFHPKKGFLLEYQHTLFELGREEEGFLGWLARDVNYKIRFETRRGGGKVKPGQ